MIESRWALCTCCDRRLRIAAGDRWQHRGLDAVLLVSGFVGNSALVTQEGLDEQPWGYDLRDLIREYTRARRS